LLRVPMRDGKKRNRLGGCVGKVRGEAEFAAEKGDPRARVTEALEAVGIVIDALERPRVGGGTYFWRVCRLMLA
jgi:hypothetical protein